MQYPKHITVAVLTRRGHLPIVPLSLPFLLSTSLASGKKLPHSTYATRQSLKELFPSTGNMKGNELRDPEAGNKLGKNMQCLIYFKENFKIKKFFKNPETPTLGQ